MHDSRRSGYRLGQDNITPLGLDIHNPVFVISGLTIGLMFFGVSEPLSHFSSSLGGTSVEDGARTDCCPR